jgi:nucleoside-diphosphate-sugar epimerase
MRVLVLGGTRFIGPPAVRRLAQAGHEVLVFHRGEHEAALPAQVRHVHSPAAGIPITGFPRELLEFRPDIVLPMMPVGERDAAAVMDAFRGVAGRVAAISSGDVYRAYGVLHRLESGSLERVPLTEDAPLRTVLYPYRKDAKDTQDWRHDYEKILVERLVMSDPVLPGTVLRLPMVFGPGDYGRRLFPYLKRMDDGRPFILLGERQARWRFHQGYVENVADAIVLAVSEARAARRIYNVGAPTTPSVGQWVRRIADHAGWTGRVITVPEARLPAHLRTDAWFEQDLVYDTSRIRSELGYRESVAPEEALRSTIAWERAHPAADFEAEKFDYAAEDAAIRLR